MLILAIRQWWMSLFITPEQAAECRDALMYMRASVHAHVAAIPTPDEVFAAVSQCERQRRAMK